MHLLAQKPDYTGSGFYLRALLKEAEQLGHEAAAVVGLGPDDQPDLPKLFPVRFETEDLPFPVVGMSDVMPYRSTVWSDLSQSQLQRYRDAFEVVVRQAVESFQPDLLHCHHLWVLTALVRDLYPDRPVVASSHGTGLRQQAKLPHLNPNSHLPWRDSSTSTSSPRPNSKVPDWTSRPQSWEQASVRPYFIPSNDTRTRSPGCSLPANCRTRKDVGSS